MATESMLKCSSHIYKYTRLAEYIYSYVYMVFIYVYT